MPVVSSLLPLFAKPRLYTTLGMVSNAKSIAELIEERQVIIIRAGGSKTNKFERAIGLLFMVAIQDYILQRDQNKLDFYIGLFLDEAHMYFNDSYEDFINLARKKRVGQFLGFQTFEQTEPYRPQILTGCSTWLIQSGLFEADARQVSMQIGERLYAVKQKSKSERGGEVTQHSESETQIYEPLWHPHHIQGLDPNHLLVMTAIDRKNVGPLEIVKPPLRKIEEYLYHEPDVPQTRSQSVFNVALEDEQIDKEFLDLVDSHGQVNNHPNNNNDTTDKTFLLQKDTRPQNQPKPQKLPKQIDQKLKVQNDASTQLENTRRGNKRPRRPFQE